jgi:hypothetical protein
MSETLKQDQPVPLEARFARVAGKLVTVANVVVRHPERAHRMGPKSRQAAAVLRNTGTAGIILEKTFLDAGALSLVFEHPDNPTRVQKLSVYSAHHKEAVVEEVQYAEAMYEEIRGELGELLIPTQYRVGEMHVNPLPRTVHTLVADQEQYSGFCDIFDPSSSEYLHLASQEMSEVRSQMKGLAEGIRLLGEKDIWVDLIGSNNVVLMPSGEGNGLDVRVLDVDPLIKTGPEDLMPSGRPVLVEIEDRITQLEQLAKVA